MSRKGSKEIFWTSWCDQQYTADDWASSEGKWKKFTSDPYFLFLPNRCNRECQFFTSIHCSTIYRFSEINYTRYSIWSIYLFGDVYLRKFFPKQSAPWRNINKKFLISKKKVIIINFFSWRKILYSRFLLLPGEYR